MKEANEARVAACAIVLDFENNDESIFTRTQILFRLTKLEEDNNAQQLPASETQQQATNNAALQSIISESMHLAPSYQDAMHGAVLRAVHVICHYWQ
jgi:hypothetical protein